jgi:hypothetical protein
MITLPALFLAATAVLWAYHRAERRLGARQIAAAASGLDQMEDTSTLAVVRSEAPYAPCGRYRHEPVYQAEPLPAVRMHHLIKGARIKVADSDLARDLTRLFNRKQAS